MSTSSSNSSGESSSTPEILPFLQQLAQFSQGLADQTYNWASDQFQQNSQLTDANVQSYLATSAAALKQAQGDTARYDNLFQPQENNLITDANTYASDARQKADAGSAEAGTAQAMDAGRQNSERDLQAFGIDPSSGRYDELEQAAQAQKAAAQAGTGQEAIRADQATGRALRSEAIQVGERYPGQIINSLNTAMQGFSGAENAKLSNTNTGANAFGTAAQFIKFPPVSNTSQSQQRSVSGSNSPGGGNKPPPAPSKGGGGGPSGSGSGSGAGGYKSGNGSGASPGMINGVPGAPSAGGDGSNPFQVNDPSASIPSQFQDNTDGAMPGGGSPFGQDPFNSSNDQMGDWGNADPSSATNGFADGSNWGSDYAGSPVDVGSASDYTGGDTSAYSGDTSYSDGYGGDTSSYDTSSYGGDYGGSYDEGSYAKGGAIGGAPGQFAGGVSPGMSPSGGAQTDDVTMPVGGGAGRAHLNAGEFVIPKDVSAWKGQEFFQKLIMQSRKARMGAPAKPTAGPGGQPHMGQ